MKFNLICCTLFFIMFSVSVAQENNKKWEKLEFLIGTWKGEGSGEPGEGEGYFSFRLDLDSNIMIRKSHSEYPPVKDKPLTIHDDLMIIYLNNSGSPDRAVYFDNEGHVINYSIAFPGKNEIVFNSDKIPNAPLFKLTYSKNENDLLNVKFEMSRDGVNYNTYIEGKSRKQKYDHNLD